MKFRIFLSLVAALLLLGNRALAQQLPALVTVDENGKGAVDTPVGSFPLPGVLLPDPGPGGLGSALTYSAGGLPIALTVGDVIVMDGKNIGDIVRFNQDNTLVFYSDNVEGVDALADTGFPTALYTNTVTLKEGPDGITYTPTPGQPGFESTGLAAVSYHFISDAVTADVPEPGTLALLIGSGVSGVLCAVRRLRRR